MQIFIASEKELQKLAQAMQKIIKGGSVIALSGNLGAGKTTFVKYFLKAAGVRQTVTSPTFVLMIPYAVGKQSYYHLDLYRLKSFPEVKALGIEQIWNHPYNTVFIEWAEKIRRHLPKNTVFMNFKLTGEIRIINIKNAPKNLEKLLK